jgi:hypothetical protein
VKLRKCARLLFVAVLLLPVARAQQSAPIQSSPAGPLAPLPPDTGEQTERSIPAAIGTLSNTGSRQAQPDTNFLSGVETFGLGSLYGLRRTFDPALYVSESRQTGLVAGRPLSASGIGGTLNLDRHSAHYHLRITYNGSETIYEPSYYGLRYLPYHDAAISHEVSLGRWTLRLRDDVLYTWGSSFSGLFTGAPVQAGNGELNSIQPSLASSATIQTGLARQLNNTASVEADYAFSRRTTAVFVGSYSVMHFLDSGFINSDSYNGRVGYNYALSAKNNIGLTYDYNLLSYAGMSGRLRNDSVQLAFGRKVTGRLAFQLAAGPQLLAFENLRPSMRRQLSWSASSAVTYQWRRATFSLSYFRGVTAGSGVYLGSTSQTVTLTASQGITKSWSGSVNGGYASNKALLRIAGLASQFDDWFAGANLNRQIGPQVRLSVNYGYQRQTSRGGLCSVSSCGLPGTFSQIGVNLNWHPLARGR